MTTRPDTEADFVDPLENTLDKVKRLAFAGTLSAVFVFAFLASAHLTMRGAFLDPGVEYRQISR